MADKLSVVEHISHVNKRARQHSVVEMFENLTARSDSGEIVGALTVFIDSDGVWHHKRDMSRADMPSVLGFLYMVLQKLTQQYLDELPADEDN